MGALPTKIRSKRKPGVRLAACVFNARVIEAGKRIGDNPVKPHTCSRVPILTGFACDLASHCDALWSATSVVDLR